jgi:hypothetical protein
MIMCSDCGKPAPKDTQITETGVVTVYRLDKNPKRGTPVLVTSTVDFSCENNHCMMWLCSCGTENDVAEDMGDFSFDPKPEISKTHSTCDNCGKRWRNAQLDAAEDLASRLDPGGTVPSGACPKCEALCYPSKA